MKPKTFVFALHFTRLFVTLRHKVVEKMNEMSFQPDESQWLVINAEGGYHLVLAPPGCGKTQILTERIRRAHADGVAYDDMLCLTFTNRAARGMQERIGQAIGENDVSKVYVGNVHRFCSKFLFENNIVAAETSIIDDEDAVSIVARFLDEDEVQVMESPQRRREYFEIIHLSHLLHQIVAEHPKALRQHPEVLTADDIGALKTICQMQRMEFNAQTMGDIYRDTDFYLTASRNDGYDLGSQVSIDRLLKRMTVARSYEQYKRDNQLVDFEDLLIMAYEAMRGDTLLETDDDERASYKKYHWIQVDEVQDLNPLQLAIIDLMLNKQSGEWTVMYLGDEQQAIFSFMGAKLSTLDLLRQRCVGHLHHLSTNHRSPEYLLNVYNEYARVVLHIDEQLLPKCVHGASGLEREGKDGDDGVMKPLRLLRSNTLETEYYDVAHVAHMLNESHPDETTAIVVNANQDADMVSAELTKMQLPHFKVSGDDLFASKEVRLLFAHLTVLVNEHNFIAWARLMRGLGVTASNAYGHNLVRSLIERAMLPSDFLCYDGSTYVQQFVQTYEERDIVVFDTETTGLDTCEDQIVQIAAVRLRQGRVVEGSEFNVFMQTTRPIPEMLGDVPNPIIEELKHHELLTPVEGLQRFADYVGDSVLLGHNAMYDWQMLKNNAANLQCNALAEKWSGEIPFDSLKLIRMLRPDLKQYKLKYLLSVLGLEGENSHLADADVAATCSLVRYCYEQAKQVLPRQQQFMAQRRVQERIATLRRNYGELYRSAIAQLYEVPTDVNGQLSSTEPCLLVAALQHAHDYFVDHEIINPIGKLHYITNYLEHDLVDTSLEQTLGQQLSAHIIEMNTLKEADLCNSSTLQERIFVSTVHKAKGLEFDNVIVFDAVEDRYPNYFNRNNPSGIAEDARKFYVALTRARRRLYVSQCLTRLDWHNQPRQRDLTRFMNPIMKYFS